MAKNPTISVCMIVKNEEANLPRLLDSIGGFADEVVVVDTGSTDRTVKIAEDFGAAVFPFTWCDDFSAARNESLAHATMDYILWLDGDDEIEKSEHCKISEHLKRHRGTAVYLRLRNIHPVEETEAIQLRMFPNHKGIQFTGRVHEQVYFSILEKGIAFTSCDGTVVHHGYSEQGTEVEKFRRNKRIHEQELLEEPDNPFPHFFLARALKGLDESEEALKSYLNFIDRAKDRPDLVALDVYKVALLEASEMYGASQRWSEALSLLETSAGRFPDFKLFGLSLGQLYFKRKEYEKAYRQLVGLRAHRFDAECVPIAVRKTQFLLRHYLGISAIFVGDHTTATECLAECVMMEPGDVENHHYLVLALERSGDLRKAIEACDSGMIAFPDDGALRKRRFLVLAKSGDFEGALADFEMLNGHSRDLDVLSAMFLMHSVKLEPAAMDLYYRLLQEGLCLVPGRPFPEDLERVRKALATGGEPQAVEFFGSAISHLLGISA